MANDIDLMILPPRVPEDPPRFLHASGGLWRDLGSDQPLRVCIEVDISWRPWGIHIGAQRSPLRSLAAVEELLDDIARHPELCLVGCMTYEAHLAGIRDTVAGSPLRNLAVQTMKAWATPRATDSRKRLAELFEKPQRVRVRRGQPSRARIEVMAGAEVFAVGAAADERL